MIELSICVFLALTLGLAVLPFVPAIAEWRKKKDIEPLRVLRASQVDVRHFAIGFRKYVESAFGPLPDAWQELEKSGQGTLEDGQPYIVVGNNGNPALNSDTGRKEPCHSLILSHGDLQLPGRMTFMAEIFADGSVAAGDETVLRAVLAEKNIDLGRGSTLLRWLHGGRSVNVRSGCVLFGRVSADGRIRIEENSRFERLNAPRIHFYREGEMAESPATGARKKNRRKSGVLRRLEIENRVEIAAGRWLVFGDLEIPGGKIVENDLVVTGRLKLAPGVRVSGSLKSRKEMYIAREVEVEGNVVSERDITIGAGCTIGGLVLSERTISIQGGSRVGSKKHPTTVSGENVFVEPGVRVHGTVWAHREGRVAVLEPERPREKENEIIQSG